MTMSTWSQNTCLSIPFWSDFICTLQWRWTTSWVVSFNPILVWFYRRRKRYSGNSLLRFQSHFGLILSQGSSEKSWLSITELSIPFWSDFITKPKFPILLDLNTFQSHFGLILSVEEVLCILQRSISFNPILVWFYLKTKPEIETATETFQSHFGLILSHNVCRSRKMR